MIAVIWSVVLVLGAAAARGEEPLVVYCAHDSVFSEPVLKAFERETGVPLSIRFDTEATKSLGLTELIIREAASPRCDVFWNNELLGTADLAQRGLLEAYQGAGWRRAPARFRDPAGRYAGFGARLRVWIVNTEAIAEPTLDAVAARMAEMDLSRVAVAKPLYGTTLTQMVVAWRECGDDWLKAHWADVQAKGLVVRGGNATVKDLVAQGVCDIGLTDTDDYFVAKDTGRPVAMLPFRLEGTSGATIAIPNTVAIVRGTQRLEAAQRLVDYLLSARVEVELSKSAARQVPLGPVNESELSPEVRELKAWASEGYDLTGLNDARAECLAWLKGEYLE